MRLRAPDQTCEQLHELERHLLLPSVEELIRLIRSDHFDDVTVDHIRAVGEYDAIELDGESYFTRAFSPGKEASSSLALARTIGPEAVLRDLVALRATLAIGDDRLSGLCESEL